MHKGWVAISQGNKELRKENVTLKANGAYSRGAKGSPGGRRDGGLVSRVLGESALGST